MLLWMESLWTAKEGNFPQKKKDPLSVMRQSQCWYTVLCYSPQVPFPEGICLVTGMEWQSTHLWSNKVAVNKSDKSPWCMGASILGPFLSAVQQWHFWNQQGCSCASSALPSCPMSFIHSLLILGSVLGLYKLVLHHWTISLGAPTPLW